MLTPLGSTPGVAVKGKVSDLPAPFYVAHRGGGNTGTDGALSTMRISAALRADVIEADIRTLRDGIAAVMHDSTINRTTTSTGNVADHSGQSWSKLVLNSAGSSYTLAGTSFPTEAPPLWERVVREFGNKVCLSPEPYDTGSLAGIDNAVVQHGISKDTILMQSQSPTTVTAARALGYRYICAISATTDVAASIAAGCTHAAIPEALVTQQWVTDMHAAGIKAGAYVVNSRYKRDALLALGVDFMFSDDPGYIKGTTATAKTDHFATASPASGFARMAGNATGLAYSSGELSWGPENGATALRLGYHQPTDASTFTRNIDLNLTSGIAQVFLGNTDHFTSPGVAGDTFDGYLFSAVQSDGTFRLEQWTDGARNGGYLRFGAAITGFTTSSWFTVRLAVTPTQLTVSFPSLGSQTQTFTDSVVRPLPYLSLGSSGTTAQLAWRTATVT